MTAHAPERMTPAFGTVHNPGAGAELTAWSNALAAEYMDVVLDGIYNHPRGLQTLIGPSEIGIPCDRALLYKLAQTPEPRRPDPPWKPQVGTACHNQMEEWFRKHPDDWEVEQKLPVGRIGPDIIKGSTDLFFRAGAVIDHKFVGPSRLKKYRRHGPSPEYKVQAHTYGRGWKLEGWPVKIVMIVFLPRDGELRDTYFWWEPYNEQIAFDALARAESRYQLLAALGLEQALTLFPYCDDPWCDWCSPHQGVGSALTNNPNPFAPNN